MKLEAAVGVTVFMDGMWVDRIYANIEFATQDFRLRDSAMASRMRRREAISQCFPPRRVWDARPNSQVVSMVQWA